MMATFLAVIGASFAIMASMMTGLVSDTLYRQRTREATRSVERLAESAAPFFAQAKADRLRELLEEQAGEIEGRLLLLDPDGKVQVDSFRELEGTTLRIPETADVLLSGTGTVFGIHRLREDGETRYTALCAAAMLDQEGQLLGAAVLSMPVDALQSAMDETSRQLLTVFVAIALAALLAALLLSGFLTRPLVALTQTMYRLGRGDLSARVKIRASGELRELADSYNAMAEQIEHLDRSRSQFVANASHELKTPLATIKLLLQNIQYQPDMDASLREEFMDDIDHEIDRLSSIITDLLTLSEMDSGAPSFSLEDVELSELTSATVRSLLFAADARGQLLRLDVTPGIHMRGDRSKLSQVIYNLTDNALKYSPEEGEITVTLRKSGNQALLTVSDNGIGIPKEDLAHIFDRFYRVDKARSRATGGTGLGLSIVRQMVKAHGGTITVTSEEGQGSTFTVTLPLEGGDG